MSFVHAIRRRWTIVVAGLVVGIIAALGITATSTPQYSTSVTMIIAPQSADGDPLAAYQGSLLTAQRMKSYVGLLSSPRIAQDVSSALGPDLGLDSAQIASRISASTQPDTVLITATVVDSSPERAQRIAGSAATSFVALVAELEQPADRDRTPVLDARVIEAAQLPTTPISPRPSTNLAFGMFLGLIVGLLLAIAIDLRDFRIRTVRDLRDATRSRPVLAELAPFDLRAGALVEETGTQREQLRAVSAAVLADRLDTPRAVIAVADADGTAGATAVATRLAATFARARMSVVLVDAALDDPGVARAAGLGGTGGLAGALTTTEVPALLQHYGTPPTVVDVLAGAVSSDLDPEVLLSERMSNLMADLASHYDIVVLATPAALRSSALAAIASRSDAVVLVARRRRTTRRRLHAVLDLLEDGTATIVGSVLTAGEHELPDDPAEPHVAEEAPDARVVEVPPAATADPVLPTQAAVVDEPVSVAAPAVAAPDRAPATPRLPAVVEVRSGSEQVAGASQSRILALVPTAEPADGSRPSAEATTNGVGVDVVDTVKLRAAGNDSDVARNATTPDAADAPGPTPPTSRPSPGPRPPATGGTAPARPGPRSADTTTGQDQDENWFAAVEDETVKMSALRREQPGGTAAPAGSGTMSGDPKSDGPSTDGRADGDGDAQIDDAANDDVAQKGAPPAQAKRTNQRSRRRPGPAKRQQGQAKNNGPSTPTQEVRTP